MAKITTTINNFSHGSSDHDINGRFDLPIYSSSSEIFQNFYSNFKGNGIYSPGYELILKYKDCRFIEFKFTAEQSYLCLFGENEIRFLTYDSGGNLGIVQSGGSDLVVATPYTVAEAKELKYDQNADVMYVVHNQHPPYKLTRTSATNFTFATFTRTSDPFDDPITGTVGWPAAVRFNKARLFYAAPTLKPTGVYGSVAALYDDFTLGSANDDDALEFQVAEIAEPIEWLMDSNNSLIAGSNEGTVAINGGSIDAPITPKTVEATLTSADGCATTQPIKKDDLLFYIRRDGRALDYFRYDVLTENFKTQNVNFLAYDITKDKISQLVYKKDRDDLVYTVRGDGTLLSLNFNETERIVAWHEYPRSGNFIQISKLSNNEGDIQLFSSWSKPS